jgi:hypothetical protein
MPKITLNLKRQSGNGARNEAGNEADIYISYLSYHFITWIQLLIQIEVNYLTCPHISGVWCKLDPKFHKPKDDEIEMYCSNDDNYIDCPVYEKYAHIEGNGCI